MGLDMYLRSETYVPGWEHASDEQKAKYRVILEQIGLTAPICEDAPSLTVRVTVAYWRKANAIHQWFVAHVQGDKDECQVSYVSRDNLEELLDTCKKVQASFKLVPARAQNGYMLTEEGKRERIIEDGEAIEDPSVAMELLPAQDGFFFGSTTYDQWYAGDVEGTVEKLERVLGNPALQGTDFYYQASW